MHLSITFDPNSPSALNRQIYTSIRQLIVTKALSPGQRLPSTRQLAKSLGISRTTVTQGYEQLLKEGYIHVCIGSGTFVSRRLPDDMFKALPIQSSFAAVPRSRRTVVLSQYGTTLANADHSNYAQPQLPINFALGRPSLEHVPLRKWRQLWMRHCKPGNRQITDYSADPYGLLPLRKAIASHLKTSRAIECNANSILIVSGCQQGLDLVARVLVDRGDAVAIENPGYRGAQKAFSAAGANIWPIPVDSDGIIIGELSSPAFPAFKVAYVTPSHQFPTGSVLSLERRNELIQYARNKGTLIVEDDYDSEYRYSEYPLPAVKALDQTNCVIYIGTFSKLLFPSLRLGYMILPPDLVEVFGRAKSLADAHCPLLDQYVLTDFINEGYLESHTRQMRDLYGARRKALVESLKQNLGERVTICGDDGGMHLMARLKTNLSDEELTKRAAEKGVGIISTKRFYFNNAPAGEFLLGFADLAEEKIAEGTRILGQIVREEDTPLKALSSEIASTACHQQRFQP